MEVTSWVEVSTLICRNVKWFCKMPRRGEQGPVHNELNTVLKRFDLLKDFICRIELNWEDLMGDSEKIAVYLAKPKCSLTPRGLYGSFIH